MVPEKEKNVSCIQAGSNINSVIKKCESPDTKVLRSKSAAESSWSANSHETLSQNVKRSEDQYVALPSNQIGTTIELPRKKPAFRMVSVQKHRALLKSALLAKYPNQKNNIENLFAKISTTLNDPNQKIKVPLTSNFKFDDKPKKKRSKSNSNENADWRKGDQSPLSALLKREVPTTNSDQSHYKITGKAIFPRFVDSNQPSGINIPYASNVNFDQRIFLLNKNPYYQSMGSDQALQYPYRVSVYSLFNPNVDTKKGVFPAKYICIRRSKDQEVGRKLIDMSHCVQLYGQRCLPNSKENCENLDGSIPMEFDDRFNAVAKVNNYVNGINRQVHLTQLPNPNLYSPYITTNQHLYFTPGQTVHDTLFRNANLNQFGHSVSTNYLICHLVDDSGVILDTKDCDQNDGANYYDKIKKLMELQKSRTLEDNLEHEKSMNFSSSNNTKLMKNESDVTTSKLSSKQSDFHVSSQRHEISEKTKQSETIVKEKNSLVQKHDLEHDLKSHEKTKEFLDTTAPPPDGTVDVEYVNKNDQSTFKPTSELTIHKSLLESGENLIQHSKTFKSVTENRTQETRTNHSESSNKKAEFYQYPLPYNLTALDLASFPCTRHLVQTTPVPEITSKPPFKVKPLLHNIIREVVNNFASQTQTSHEYKVHELEIENSSKSYVAPEIIRTPVVKDLFSVPQVENLLVENVNKLLRNVSDLTEYISRQSITDNLVRSQIKDFVDHIPLVHPTVTTKTSVEQEELSRSLEQIIHNKEIKEKQIPSNFLLSTLHHVISQSRLNLQALQNRLVKKIIVQSVKNSLMSSANVEKHWITEAEIQNALNYLLVSQMEPKFKSEDKITAQSLELGRSVEKSLQSQVSVEQSSEFRQKLTNQQLHDHITSTIRSSKDNYHKDSSSTESKSENLDDLLHSIENNPIKYYSQSDRITEYIKNNKNKLNENSHEDLSTSHLQHPTTQKNNLHFFKETKQSSQKNQSQEESISHVSKESASVEIHDHNDFESESTEKFDQTTLGSRLSSIKQVFSLSDLSAATTSRVYHTTKKIRTVPREEPFGTHHVSSSSETSKINKIKKLLDSRDESENSYQTTITDSKESTSKKMPQIVSKSNYSKMEEHKFEAKQLTKESEEYHEIVKNHGIENKLFTVSHENTEDYSEMSTRTSEEDLSSTKRVAKIRTPRTTQRSKQNGRSKKYERTETPSIYDEDEFYSYSTSVAKSVENYEDETEEFYTEATIPNALYINKESAGIVEEEHLTYANDYPLESGDVLNERSEGEETSTTDYYDDEEDYSREIVHSPRSTKVQRYTQEPTDKIERLALKDERKKNCAHKSSEEDVTVDATKINEEFSTTTEYPAERSDKRHSRKKMYHNLESEEKLLVKETKGLVYKVEEKSTPRPVVTYGRGKSKAMIKEPKKDPLYIGKLVAKEKPQVFDYLNGIDLFYIGDGVRLPITLKKLPDGSFSLSLSDSICQVILKTKCVRNEDEKKEQSWRKNKKNRARRSHEAFKITSADGLDIGFYDDRLLSRQKGELDIDESRNIDDLTQKDREQVVLNALDNLKNLAHTEIDSIVNEAKQKYDQVKSSPQDKSIDNSR